MSLVIHAAARLRVSWICSDPRPFSWRYALISEKSAISCASFE
jgi:hypothetical protein